MSHIITLLLNARLLLLLLLLMSIGNNAYHQNNDRNHVGQFSLNQHYSFDPKSDEINISAETETLTYFDKEDRNISTAVLFCNGGGGILDTNYVVSMTECRLPTDEDDEDDDQDDDGHSSMLSNTFLRKKRLSESFIGDELKRNDFKMRSKEAITKVFVGMGEKLKQSKNSLEVRGGGESSSSVSLKGSELMKRLIVAALVTLLFEACLGHLLEFLKISIQTSPPGTTYWNIFKDITSEKGIAGIWDGFVPWGIIQSVGKGGVFGLANSVALSLLLPLCNDGILNPKLAKTIAGGIGGGFQGFVLSPTLLLKTRVMTNSIFREKMSLLRTILLSFSIGFDVVKNEGMLALMKGANVFALKRVFDWATRFYFSDIFQTLFTSSNHSISNTHRAIADFLGGVLSTISTLPLDVLVAQIQDAKKAGIQVSALDMFRQKVHDDGWDGFMRSYTRGFIARLLHVCFTTVAMKTGTQIMYDSLFQ